MKTRREAVHLQAEFDSQVTAWLEAQSASSGDGKPMCIGIRNELGYIYRHIETRGLPEFMAACEFLGEFLTDELTDPEHIAYGCDAVFYPKARTPA